MKTSKSRSGVALTRSCVASGAGKATGGCSRNRLALPVTCRSRCFESKAHGAQRQRHTEWVGDERKQSFGVGSYWRSQCETAQRWPKPTPCNAAIESRSRFLEVF